MNIKHIINATLAAAIGALGFSGCRTTKQVANVPDQPAPPVIIDRPDINEPPPLVYGPPPTPYRNGKDTLGTDSTKIKPEPDFKEQPKVYGPPPTRFRPDL